MASDPTKYRKLKYIGGRVLQDRELNTQQDLELIRDNQAMGAVYREGATLNVAATDLGGGVLDLAAIDGSRPLLVFVRGSFEPFAAGTVAYDSGKTSGQDFLYANWELKIRTSVDDPLLVADGTGDPVAEAGEMILDISATDTSGVGLAGDQLEKNIVPIIMFTLDRGVGGSITVQYTDNVNAEALADGNNAGPVQLTTTTAAGVATATDDPRNTDDRAPLDDTIDPAKVKALVQTGINPDTSPQYDPATPSQGGTTTDKSIYTTLKQTVTWALDNLHSLIDTLQTNFGNHVDQKLGLTGSHPMPTAQEIGAAPLSHVGANLGVAHPAVLTSDTDGYEVVRSGTIAADPNNYALQVREGPVVQAGVSHDGDVFALLPNGFTATPLEGGLATGALGRMGKIAQVLSEHVNSHPNKNPHGLTAADLGAVSQATMDSADAGILALALAFADKMGSVIVRSWTSSVVGVTIPNVPGPNDFVNSPISTSTTYVIFTFSGRFEIALGFGVHEHGQAIPLPEDGVNWPTANFMGTLSPRRLHLEYDQDNPAEWDFVINNTTRVVTAHEQSAKKGVRIQIANTLSLAWRSVTAPPIIIQFLPTSDSIGNDIIITGRNFGSSTPTVDFNGTSAITIVANGPTSITVTVPVGATTGVLTVTNNDIGLSGVSDTVFTVI